jgi:hypothetical protein
MDGGVRDRRHPYRQCVSAVNALFIVCLVVSWLIVCWFLFIYFLREVGWGGLREIGGASSSCGGAL